MSLRGKILVYLVAIHVALALLAVLLLREQRLWLIAFELLFLLSIALGFRLVRALFVPLDLIRTGGELIRERDFGTHFTEIGHPEMDRLIRVYNGMVDRLREERLKLQEQDLFLDRLLTAAPSGVITLDHDGRVVMLNPAAAAWLAVEADSIVGSRLSELALPAAGALDDIPAGESRIIALQGRRRLLCRRAGFLDRGAARDFYVLEELTEELRASEKAAYDKLIRLMSHEVNNSVGSVRSLLESCGNYSEQIRESDRDDYRNALQVASARMEHLGAFVNDFADVVRLPAPRTASCDLPRMLRDLILLTTAELASRRIEIELAQHGPWPALSLDKNQIEQVLLNVIKNAGEAIGSDGRIEVHLDAAGPAPRLRVLDSGPGIPETARPHLFTPFFTTKRDGRGLGLTMIREVLGQHGCDFGLENRPEGGAEFWILFPRRVEGHAG